MSTRKPREFWIQLGTPDFIAESYQEAQNYCEGLRSELPIVHAIEYIAYAEIKSKLQIAVEALEEVKDHFHYCSVCDAATISYEALNKIKGDAE